MSNMIKRLTLGLGLTILLAVTAHADGVYKVFKPDGSLIDEIEVVGDVTMPSGEALAVLEMREQHLRFYVDPSAIYLDVRKDNPVFTQETPFYGFWISTQSVDTADWPACDNYVMDESGAAYRAHGTLVWTNTGIAKNGYEPAFHIDLGTCSSRQELWALSSGEIETSSLGIEPNDDISTDGDYIIVDANGLEFLVDITDVGATLISRKPQKIVIQMADAESTSKTYVEHEVLEMYADCSTTSWLRGYGTWSWANGGFIVDFDDASFSFPRMDAPVDDHGACRM